MDSASLEHLLRRGDAKVRRQGATHAATRYDEYDGLCSVCSDSNAASCVFIDGFGIASACICSRCSVGCVLLHGIEEVLARARWLPHSQAWIRMDSAALQRAFARVVV